MKGLHWTLLLVITCVALVALSTLVAFTEAPPQPEPAKSVDPEIQIVSEKLLGGVPAHIGVPAQIRDYFRWPTSAEIAAGSASGDKVDQVKISCVKWIHTVLSDKWIPADLAERLVAQNQGVRDNDAVRVRYEFQGYYLQIVQTSGILAVAVKSTVTSEPIPKSAAAHEELVTDTVHLFLNEADKVLTCCMPRWGSQDGVTHGKYDGRKVPGGVYWWYGVLLWWTDGETVAFIFQKGDGRPRPYMVHLIEDWF